MIVLVSAGFLLASLLVSRATFRRTLPLPSVVFFAMWTVVLMLSVLDATHFHIFGEALPSDAIVLYVLSFLAFFLGSSLPLLARSSLRRNVSTSASKFSSDLPWRSLYRLTWLFLIAFALIVAVKYSVLIPRYGNPIRGQAAIRQDFALGRLSFPAYLNASTILANVAILNVAILWVFRKRVSVSNGRLTFQTGAAFGIAFLNDTTIADKGTLSQALLLIFALVLGDVLLRSARFSFRLHRRELVIAAGFVLLLSTITFLRSPGDLSLVEGGPLHFYVNTVGNVASSGYFINHPFPRQAFGWYTLNGIYQFVLGLGTVFGLASPGAGTLASLDRSVFVAQFPVGGVYSYNTTSYLAYLYSDFGFVGSIVLSALGGLAASVAFLRAVRRRRLFGVGVVSLVCVGMVTSVRGVYFGAIGFWLTIAMLWLQYRVLTRVKAVAVPPTRSKAPRPRRAPHISIAR